MAAVGKMTVTVGVVMLVIGHRHSATRSWNTSACSLQPAAGQIKPFVSCRLSSLWLMGWMIGRFFFSNLVSPIYGYGAIKNHYMYLRIGRSNVASYIGHVPG